MSCPMLTAIDVAQDLLDKYADVITDASVRGHLELYREIAEQVHKRHDCQTVANADGQLVCSLAQIFGRVYDQLVPVAMIASNQRAGGSVGAML
jgi:hypothetical protein